MLHNSQKINAHTTVLRKNQKNSIFGDIILFENIEFTIYLFTMACVITRKKFMPV